MEQLQEKHQEFKHEVTMRISQKNKIIKSLEDKVYTHTNTHTNTHTHTHTHTHTQSVKKNIKSVEDKVQALSGRETNASGAHISFEPLVKVRGLSL